MVFSLNACLCTPCVLTPLEENTSGVTLKSLIDLELTFMHGNRY